MYESRSAIYKMLKDEACKDRQICRFPPPYRSDATPYSQRDFARAVRDACSGSLPVVAGLKISKAVFLGDVGVGKTCLINRFCHQVFDSNYKATIGVDFEVERFDVLQVPYNLQIWDTAGQERFKSIAASYYRGAHVVAVVFDLTSTATLAHCAQWLREALEVNRGDPRVFLVGTKRDLLSAAGMAEAESNAVGVAARLGAELWAVSSKTGENVAEMFSRMAALSFDASVRKEQEAGNGSVLTVGSDLVSLKRAGGTACKQRQKCGGCAK
ncbi:ras-related protein Rab-34-like [Bacillus rossius redtenbacheri]|uniref:ras-related protein Rab-34-like n=1 Tax=Bacillus rossius redtenbacheri TaxID=93214 RepID=UPI002FDC7AA8